MICTYPSCGLEISRSEERRERVYISVSSKAVFSKRMHDACAEKWETEKTGIRHPEPGELKLLLSPATARTRMLADRVIVGNRRRTARIIHDFRRKAQ
jgi:hypothetical protein